MAPRAGPSSATAGDFLVIVLDLDAVAWADLADVAGQDVAGLIEKTLETVLVFSNAHLALRHENHLAIYAALSGRSELLFSTIDANADDATVGSDGSTYQKFRIVDEGVLRGLRMALGTGTEDTTRPVGIVSALAKALCHINRVSKGDSAQENLRARVLMLSVSPDSAGQYIPIMNCIFSAQKSNVPIDVCRIAAADAVFWQQAGHLTSGTYYRLPDASGLLQALMMAFLPGREARRRLNLPRQEQVDLRAACFCHRHIIDIGYVCSVCLSIFCSPIAVCSTCKTRFPLSTLKRLRPQAPAARKPPAARTTPRPPAGAINGR